MPTESLTDAERAERAEQHRRFARQAVERLRESDGWRAWLASRRHFHDYSFANQLLIAHQHPEATRVAGFRAWLKLGYAVARGQQAIRIWVPMPPSKRQLERWHQDGADPDSRPRTFFKLGPVFDRSQVQPLPPPAQPVPLDPPIREVQGDELAPTLPRLTVLATHHGSTVSFEPLADSRRGYYELDSRRIVIHRDMPANAQVKTLVHELAHALLRVQPVDQRPQLSRAAEELVAESVAFTVCGTLGLDTAGYSIPYLTSWSQTTSLEIIEQTASLIDTLATTIENAALAEADCAGDDHAR